MAISALKSKLFEWVQVADIRSPQLTADAAHRYRREQIQGTIEQMRVLLMGNTLFAPMLALQAWPSGSHWLVIGWTLLMLGHSWWLSFSWLGLYHTDGNLRDMTYFHRQALFDALCWLLGMGLFYPLVEGDQKAVLAAITAGVLAIGTLGWSRATVPGLTFLFIVAIGFGLVTLVTGLRDGSLADFFLAGLAVLSAIALSNAVMERGRAALAAFQDHEALADKTEMVELLLRDYEAQANEWFWQTDEHGDLVAAPAPIIDLLGLEDGREDHIPLFARVRALCTPESDDGIARMADALRNRTEFHDIYLSFRDAQTNKLRWMAVKGRARFENGVFLGFRGILADATATVEAERRVNYLAAFDSLTDLLNRNSVQKRLAELDSDRDEATAYLIDLDGFKQINDSYGHHVGDKLLQGAGHRLRELEDTHGWTARLAGDEFFLLSSRPHPNVESAKEFGQLICKNLSQPFKIDSFELQVSASVGISRFPKDTAHGPELLSLSDLALYDAKAAGRNCAHHYDRAMLDKLNERIAVIERLRDAVRTGAVRPFYQSQHRLVDGRLIGFEALARWTDEELGFVGPDIFIPIAEQTGMIVELGEQLMRAACEDAARWAAILKDDAPVISVNISPVQFARSDVANMLASVLRDTGLSADRVSIEVTEGVLISDKKRVASTLRQLSDMGVSIALDDFGTGYSSLSYLKELPLDRLKIDRAFVNDLEVNAISPIVSTVIQLGHNLGLGVIAEGVETQLQVDRLTALGCDDGQGYHYGRPMPVDQADEYVAGLAAEATEADADEPDALSWKKAAR